MKTLKEAIFTSLEELNRLTTYLEVCSHITTNNYYNFGNAKTPSATVSALLGDFIRNGDTRVKRIKLPGNTYGYYLTKNESQISPELLAGTSTEVAPQKPQQSAQTYMERDLHKLLSTYLKSTGVFSKTIFHEQSTYGKDSNQIWTHPDMVGIKFTTLQNKASRSFLKAINRKDTFKLSAYEIKREISSDADLKKAYFQAVSNSSWANYGYLVAFEFNFTDSLKEEMERLNQSFGIGVIELYSNPYQSKVLFPAKDRDLDFKTIDKLSKINKEFETFIEQTEKLLSVDERYYNAMEKELDEFCDNYFSNDAEVIDYCKKHHIPLEEEIIEIESK